MRINVIPILHLDPRLREELAFVSSPIYPYADCTRYACNSLTSRRFTLMRLRMQMSALSEGIYR